MRADTKFVTEHNLAGSRASYLGKQLQLVCSRAFGFFRKMIIQLSPDIDEKDLEQIRECCSVNTRQTQATLVCIDAQRLDSHRPIIVLRCLFEMFMLTLPASFVLECSQEHIEGVLTSDSIYP